MSELLLPGPLATFQCNGRGCCCTDWRIRFESHEAPKLARIHPEGADGLNGTRFLRAADGEIRSWESGREDLPCVYLDGDQKCGLRLLNQTLQPRKCRSYPAQPVVGDGVTRFGFSVVCPEVRSRLINQSGPVAMVAVTSDDWVERTGYQMALPEALFGDRVLSLQELFRVQTLFVNELNRRDMDVFDSFAFIGYGLTQLANGCPVDGFDLPRKLPLDSFDLSIVSAVLEYDPEWLAKTFASFRRFVFSIDFSGINPVDLFEMCRTDLNWHERLDLEAPDIQVLIRRYLALRFLTPFSSELDSRVPFFTWPSIAQSLATGIRYGSMLLRWLPESAFDGDSQVTALQIGLGASDFFHRDPIVLGMTFPWVDLPATEAD